MIGVMIVPTGIGAEIGGHAGDASPASKLLAACCDTLILHPNVVNASDINEMPDNAWYVEGSTLDRFLMSKIRLRRSTRANRILVVCNAPVTELTMNAVNAARCTIGADIQIEELDKPLAMKGWKRGCIATGEVHGVEALIKQVVRRAGHEFDALAVHTPIDVPRDVALTYYRQGGVNPWGGVEALASKMISLDLPVPVAHAPLETTGPDDTELFNVSFEHLDPRIAAEAVSHCYLHCVLKGLHRAPRIHTMKSGLGIDAGDVDWMIAPWCCWGFAHDGCKASGIPILHVTENRTVFGDTAIGRQDMIPVNNYWEAAGYVTAMRAGVSPASVRRPL